MGGLNDVVSPGDPVEIPASVWNAVLRAARLAEGNRLELPDSYDSAYPVNVAKVRNDSGAALSRFDAVGLGAPIITPTQNLAEFKRQPSFKVVKPVAGTHEGKFGILLEPLADGAIGSAAVAGAVPAQITGADVGFAEVQNGSTILLAVPGGSAQVVWADAGSGQRWAIIRFSGGGGGGIPASIQVCTPGGNKTLTFEGGRLTAVA